MESPVNNIIPVFVEVTAFWEKGIHVIWQLAAKSSMARTKSGNRSMVPQAVIIGDRDVSRKRLLGASLTLRNYNAQVGKAYAMSKALNKLTGIGMPETQYVV